MHPRRLGALLLLATLVAGGVLVPAAHRIEHAVEAAEVRAEHLAQAGGAHHHHTAAEHHGTEATAPCPDPLALDLDCAVCAGLAAHVAVATGAAPALVTLNRAWPRAREEGLSVPAAAHAARGPPAV